VVPSRQIYLVVFRLVGTMLGYAVGLGDGIGVGNRVGLRDGTGVGSIVG